jgi:hypothetical protein
MPIARLGGGGAGIVGVIVGIGEGVEVAVATGVIVGVGVVGMVIVDATTSPIEAPLLFHVARRVAYPLASVYEDTCLGFPVVLIVDGGDQVVYGLVDSWERTAPPSMNHETSLSVAG